MVKNKKATINSKNIDDKCFQYVATNALNYEEIQSHLERVSNIKPFINEYNRKAINYPSKIDDSNVRKKNATIVLNILCIQGKE